MIQTDVPVRPGNLQIPACSADWRFLLPLGAQPSVLVVTPDCDDFGVSFDAINIRNTTQRVEDFMAGGHAETHDVVAFPLGIPADFSASLHQVLDTALHMLKPAGAVLFGFVNRWGLPGHAVVSSTLHEMKNLLRNVGYAPIEIYCAFPNLHTSEYIFSPLISDLQFILRRRYRHKLPSPLLSLLTLPVAARLLLKAVPCYYAVAERADSSRQ